MSANVKISWSFPYFLKTEHSITAGNVWNKQNLDPVHNYFIVVIAPRSTRNLWASVLLYHDTLHSALFVIYNLPYPQIAYVHFLFGLDKRNVDIVLSPWSQYVHGWEQNNWPAINCCKTELTGASQIMSICIVKKFRSKSETQMSYGFSSQRIRAVSYLSCCDDFSIASLKKVRNLQRTNEKWTET